jgi:DNA-binding response OmpR family regulator
MARSRILIVDDELILTRLTAKRLRSAGFEVECHFEGTGAIDLIRRTMPDLVLLDIMLPGVSGYEIFEGMRGNGELRDIPIIFFTAKSAGENDRVHLADAYIKKPYQPENLIATVKRVLSRRKEC